MGRSTIYTNLDSILNQPIKEVPTLDGFLAIQPWRAGHYIRFIPGAPDAHFPVADDALRQLMQALRGERRTVERWGNVDMVVQTNDDGFFVLDFLVVGGQVRVIIAPRIACELLDIVQDVLDRPNLMDERGNTSWT